MPTIVLELELLRKLVEALSASNDACEEALGRLDDERIRLASIMEATSGSLSELEDALSERLRAVNPKAPEGGEATDAAGLIERLQTSGASAASNVVRLMPRSAAEPKPAPGALRVIALLRQAGMSEGDVSAEIESYKRSQRLSQLISLEAHLEGRLTDLQRAAALLARYDAVPLEAAVNDALNAIGDKTLIDVIRHRYGIWNTIEESTKHGAHRLEEGQVFTQETVARQLGISQPQVSRLLRKALRKLKHPNSSRILRLYFDRDLPFIREAILLKDLFGPQR
jgi:hypothetical protein